MSTTIHLKDLDKSHGIRCGRWHTSMCYIVDASKMSMVSCKGCLGVKRAPPRFPKAARTLQAGDILSASWGYDQTNVDFYQVTRLIGNQSVEIRKIHARMIDSNERGADYLMPVKDSFFTPANEYDDRGRLLIRRANGTSVNVDDCRYASLWSGEAKYQTATGWGH